MKIKSIVLPSLALGAAALLVMPGTESKAFTTIGGNLSLGQRDVRVFNNFADPTSNDNVTPILQFSGFLGAEMAIWKAIVEWGSEQHGAGTGDNTQFPIGSGGANYDAFWAGNANGVGGTNNNITSAVSSCASGVIAFAETPISNGWRIRFCDGNFNFDDGPGNVLGNSFDIQGIMAHEFGHALGLGHSIVAGSTMFASGSSGSETERSIEADDVAGVQFIYGVKSIAKPLICRTTANAGTLTIRGHRFNTTNNEVWFTSANSTGTGAEPRVRLFNVPSTNGGSRIDVAIPAAAGPGDVAVRLPGNNSVHLLLSNAFPTNLTGNFTSDICGQVFSVTALASPSTIDALVPGTSQFLTITGTGFEALEKLTLLPFSGSNSVIDTSNYTVVDDTTITVDVPQAPIGFNEIQVDFGSRKFNAGFTVVAPAEPKFQLGTGVALNATANGNDLLVITSGVVGTQHRVFFSTNPAPSSVNIITLQFGNQFAEIFQGPTFTIPAVGYFEHLETIAGIGAPTVFYAQSVDLTTPVNPDFDVSNLQTITLTP